MNRVLQFVFACALAVALSGCGELRRSDNASAARMKMVGLTKEQTLSCMGPPRQKAHVGATEVWSYTSTDLRTDAYSNTMKLPNDSFSFGSKAKSFCTVNIVMTDERVTAVRYNGPRDGTFTDDEQCGYAVEHCVD